MSVELSSLGIAQIVESAIADYDLRDEDGNELIDDLYVIRSEQLDELGLTVARRIHKAIRELETQGKTGFPVHSMAFGSMPVTIAKDGDRTYTLRFDNSDEAVGHHTAQPDRTHGHQETDQRVFEGGEEP